ncbi:hypothetical protein D9M68_880780 [compost metagenome]
MASAAPSFCHATENKLALHWAPAIGEGPALVAMVATPDSAKRGRLPISTLENDRPTMASTRSRSINLRTACCPTSGFSWSSSLMTLVGCPPSLPPN